MKQPFWLYEEAGGDAGSGGGGTSSSAPAGNAGAGAGGGSSAPAGSGASLLAGAGSQASGAGSSTPSAPNAGQGGQGANGAPVAGESWFAGLYDAQGKINAAKFDALPPHLKQYKDTFAKYQTVEALLGGFANASSLAGKKALAPLPADAPPEAKAERAKLLASINGTPEKPEGYGFKRPDAIPETHWDQAYADGVASILHKYQASPELARELMEHDAKHAGGALEKVQAAQAAAEAAEAKSLRDEWGNDYGKNIDLAVRGAKTLGMDVNDPIFKNAAAVKMAAKFASMISEDRLVSGETSANAGMSDREKALDIVNNPANPLHKAYHDDGHPQHAEAVATRSRFNQAWLAKQKAGARA